MVEFADDVVHRAFVIFLDGHVEQVAGIGQAAGQFVEGLDDLRQCSAFTAEILCVFRIVPDVRVFQLAIDFGQAVMLLIVVKDTPE
ncbi:hypothetical protein D3C85_539020 [compost metagenome]